MTLGGVTSSVFVGRDDELAALTEGLREVADGTSRCVLIGGEAGMDKSRLVVSTPTRAPVVTRISPARGTHLGGTLVTITGRNFTGVTAIRIGGVLMKSVHCSSSTTCTAITPRGTGTKAIRVTTAAGTSAYVSADRFTYL